MIDKDKLSKLFIVLRENLPLGNWKINLKFITGFEIGEITGNDTDYAVTSYKDKIECVDIYMNEDAIYREWDNPENTLIHEFIHHYDNTKLNIDIDHDAGFKDRSKYLINLLKRESNQLIKFTSKY